MEVRPGYKLTEIGVIPEDWDAIEFQRLYLEPSRNGLSRSKAERGQGYKMVNMGELFAYAQISNQEMERVQMTPTEIRDFSLVSGDLLFARQSLVASGVGKCSIFHTGNEITTYESHIIRVRLKKQKAVPEFYFHFFNSSLGSKTIRGLITQIAAAGIKGSELAQVRLPFPPTLAEQRAIADALSDVDDQISALDDLIAKKRDIKQGAMQRLLTGEERLPGFNETWEVNRLADICNAIIDGTHFTPQYVEDGIPFYSVENVTANNFTDTKFISPEEHARLIRRCRPERGDILLTRIGALGVTKLIDWDVNASIYVSLALLKPNNNVDSSYLYNYSKSTQFVRDLEKRSLVNYWC